MESNSTTAFLFEILTRIIVPVTAAVVSGTIAIYAIRRTDKRERVKRRREALIENAMVLIEKSEDYEREFWKLYQLWTRQKKPIHDEFFILTQTMSFWVLGQSRKYSMMGETVLSAAMLKFHSVLMDQEQRITTIIANEAEAMLSPFDLVSNVQSELKSASFAFQYACQEAIDSLDRASADLFELGTRAFSGNRKRWREYWNERFGATRPQ